MTGEEKKRPPVEWVRGARDILQGADYRCLIQRSESWEFTSDVDSEEVTGDDYSEHYHITVFLPEGESISGHGPTLVAAVTSTKDRLKDKLKGK